MALRNIITVVSSKRANEIFESCLWQIQCISSKKVPKAGSEQDAMAVLAENNACPLVHACEMCPWEICLSSDLQSTVCSLGIVLGQGNTKLEHGWII